MIMRSAFALRGSVMSWLNSQIVDDESSIVCIIPTSSQRSFFLFPQFFVTYWERETTAPSPNNLSVTRPTHYTPWADDHVKVVSCHHSLSPCFHSESEREISSFWPTIELLMANIHWLITYGRLNVVLLCRKNPTTLRAFSWTKYSEGARYQRCKSIFY